MLHDGFDIRSWTVSRYLREITPGDDVAMWITGAGVRVLGEVTSPAGRPVTTWTRTGSTPLRQTRSPSM
jgi:hypothetical protein